MATLHSPNPGSQDTSAPASAAWLGIIAVVFGILLTAGHANEWLTQKVISPDSAAARGLESECPEDELEEEGLSAAECRLMVSQVRIMIASRPPWFRAFQMGLASVGTVLALLSIFAGIALIDNRPWAGGVALVIFGTLLAIDLLEFIAAVNVGPLLRAMYLWNILLWFFIHLCMTVAAVAGRGGDTRRSPAIEN